MLKIKDDVDLKELRKFGFEVVENIFGGIYCVKGCSNEDGGMTIDTDLCISNHFNRVIDLECSADCSDEYTFNISSNCNEILNTMFDLIQAGLVEKVGQ